MSATSGLRDEESLDEVDHCRSRRAARTMLILLAVCLHLTALLNAKPLQSANDRSRWCTVWSLVERGTFQIDEIRQRPGWDSIDIIHDNGHFYSTKPPLMTVIVAGLTWCVSRVTGWTLLNDTQAVTATVLFLINIVPFAASLWLLNRILNRHSRSETTRLLVLSTAAFGTLLTPFLMTLNNHTVAAAGVTVALFCLMTLISDEAPRFWTFALCGAASAWTCANELPAGAFGLATFCLAWMRSPRVTLRGYIPAALAPLVALIVTNVIATGSWKPTYASYGSSKYNFVIDGVPSYWMNPQGVDRNLDSPLMYLFHCTLGHHGIWSLTPIFLLSVAGWWMGRREQDHALRAVLRSGALLTVVVITFYLTRTQNYNYGGVSCALRWSLWLIPLWLIALVPAIDRFARVPVFRCFAGALLSVSVVSAWLPVPNPWQQPWLFHRLEDWGWIDYAEEPPELPKSQWTWFASLLPGALGSRADADGGATAVSSEWIEFTSPNADGSASRMKVTVSREQDGLVKLLVERRGSLHEGTSGASSLSTRTLFIDEANFNAGLPPAEFVRWPDRSVTSEQKQADLTFVRGLPLKQEFRAGVIRYLKTPLRKDAFRCQRAAAQVLFSPTSGGTAQRYRCDLWLCDELPLGVAQFEFQVLSADGTSPAHIERWTATSSSRGKKS